MSNSAYLVLDIDGVLQAPSMRYGFEQQRVIVETHRTADVHPSLWPRNWHGYGADRRRKDRITFRTPVRVSPMLLADLSELPVQIVMLTTWLENESSRAFLAQATPDHEWFPGAIHLEFPGRDADGMLDHAWKLALLRELLANDPRPFVWIDDDEVPLWGDAVDRDYPHLSHRMIAPSSDVGLTRDHLNSIRSFIATTGA